MLASANYCFFHQVSLFVYSPLKKLRSAPLRQQCSGAPVAARCDVYDAYALFHDWKMSHCCKRCFICSFFLILCIIKLLTVVFYLFSVLDILCLACTGSLAFLANSKKRKDLLYSPEMFLFWILIVMWLLVKEWCRLSCLMNCGEEEEHVSSCILWINNVFL